MTAAEVFSAVTKDMRSWLVCDPKPRCVGAIGAVTALRSCLKTPISVLCATKRRYSQEHRAL